MSRNNIESSFNTLLFDIYMSIHLEYDNLHNLLNVSASLSDKQQSEIEEKVSKWNDNNPEHEYAGHEVFENDIYKLLSYDKEINYAIFVLAFAKFEATLNKICTLIGDEKGFTIRVFDISGKGIHRSRKYLEKMFLVNFSELNSEWSRIVIYSELRNKIVHSYGEITIPDGVHVEETDALKKFKKLTGIGLTTDNFITIENDTVKEFIFLSDKFLNDILDILKEN